MVVGRPCTMTKGEKRSWRIDRCKFMHGVNVLLVQYSSFIFLRSCIQRTIHAPNKALSWPGVFVADAVVSFLLHVVYMQILSGPTFAVFCTVLYVDC